MISRHFNNTYSVLVLFKWEFSTIKKFRNLEEKIGYLQQNKTINCFFYNLERYEFRCKETCY